MSEVYNQMRTIFSNFLFWISSFREIEILEQGGIKNDPEH